MGNRVCLGVFLGFGLTTAAIATVAGQHLMNYEVSTAATIASLLISLMLCTTAALAFQRHHLTQTVNQLQTSKKKLEHRVQAQTRSLDQSNRKLVESTAQLQIRNESLKETQNYLSSVLNSSTSILIGVTADGIITHWNEKSEKLTGIFKQQAVGKSLQSLIQTTSLKPLIDFDLLGSVIKENTESKIQKLTVNQFDLDSIESTSSQFQNNSEVLHGYYDLTITPLSSNPLGGAIIRIEDVSHEVQVESLSIQTEKLLALGEMAAGLAHEMNNPLSTILQASQNFVRRTNPEQAKNKEVANKIGIDLELLNRYCNERGITSFIDAIRSSGSRASQTVRQMLEFAKPDHRRVNSFSMNEVITKTLGLMKLSPEFKLHPRVSITTSLSNQLPNLHGTSSEIQQVIINLIRNCFQTLSPQDPGQNLNITLNSYLKSNMSMFNEDQLICLEITDNGPGIKEDLLPYIFKPFFTTKLKKGGTGLGLSVCKTIIEKHHNGKLDVTSSEKGTTFTITLPSKVTVKEMAAEYA